MNKTRTSVALAAALLFAGIAKAQQEPDASGVMQVTTTKTMETYVPKQSVRIASIELAGEATVTSRDVTLRQVCRWPEGDGETFEAVADLVVLRLDADKGFATLSMEEIQTLLRDAGVNPGMLNFAGAASCTVSRSDVKVDEAEALRTWVGGTNDRKPTVPSEDAQAALVADAAARQQARLGKGDADPSAAIVAASAVASAKTGDLRARLITDVATRLNLPVETLQVDFKAEDRKLLSLREPFEFTIEPQRHGDLGETSWLVTISSGGESRRVRISASARAWMTQVVLSKPLGLRQTISEADFEVRRVLADRLTHDVLATKEQAIGQQAARDLKPGTVLTGKMLAPPELCRAGQLVTVHMRRGVVEVKSVAIALQSGSAGQTIKVKNERTNQVFQVTLVGQQMAVMSASDPVAAVD